jgi:hypothetical protein
MEDWEDIRPAQFEPINGYNIHRAVEKLMAADARDRQYWLFVANEIKQFNLEARSAKHKRRDL